MELPKRNIKVVLKEPGLLEAVTPPISLQLPALEQLIKKFAPIVCFHPEEEFMPVNIEEYLQKAWLVNSLTKTKVPAGEANLFHASENKGKYHLELKDNATGFYNKRPAKAYVHAKAHGNGYTDLQYWFFYARTGSASAIVKWLIDGKIKGYEGTIDLNPLGKFNGNWERLTVRINNMTRDAEQVFFSQPGKSGWMPISEVERRGSQVFVYAAKSNYAFCPSPGLSHTEKVRFNLYSSQLEFCIQHERAHGRELDFASACELVSAEHLGENKPSEPFWLNFQHNWGNPNLDYLWGNANLDYLTVSSVKRIVLSTFGKTIGFLLSRDVLDELVSYLLFYFTEELRYKSLSPKAKKCWEGDEAD